MYTKITNPSVDVYDGKTNQFLGEARFELTSEAEQELLNWINNRVPFRSLIMLNSDFQPSENYVPIVPNKTYHQKGIFRALLTEGDTGKKIPVEIRGTYDWRARSVEPGTFLSSVEYSNVKIDEIEKISI